MRLRGGMDMPEKEKDDVDNVVQANRFHVQGLGFKCACVCPFVCVCVYVCASVCARE